jgi:lysozyme
MSLAIYTGARGSRFVCDSDKGFGDAVAQISINADAPINSCAREAAAEPLLAKIGKMSQSQLFKCSQERIRTGHCPPNCHGNCNPANPPGASTHERRNDGKAYAGRVGRLLTYWQRGIDVQRDRVAAFIAEARRRGYTVTQTYPGSVTESQHVNFRKAPKISLWKVRPLKHGMGANPLDRARLASVVRRLKKIQEPGKRVPYLDPKHKFTRFGPTVESAVKRFQRDHHLKADGVVGLGTYHLLGGTARRPPSRLNQAGIDFLVRQEGEVLHAYDDPAGHATFGVGHLLHHGRVTASDIAAYGSKEHPKDRDKMRKLSRRFLNDDVTKHERAVMAEVPERWRGSHDRFNAFTSLSFNLGEEILTPEAPLKDVGLALRQKPDKTGVTRMVHAVEEFNKGGSPPRTLPGLKSRREAEANLIRRNH